MHEYVGEALEVQDRLEEALRWFNSGVTHLAREDPEELDVGCLNGRYRVRRRLAMPRDRYDELCEERRTEARAELEALREERRSAEPGGQQHASEPGIVRRITLLHWQPEELVKALRRWPSMSEHHGSTYAEHKAEVEGRCRELSEAGITASVGEVSVEEFVDFAEHGDRDPAALSTRAAFAAHLATKEAAMSESEQQPFGGRNERPDDDTLPGERPADEDEKKVGPPGDKNDHETASRAAEQTEMASRDQATGPTPGIPERVEPPSPADATEGDPPGGSAANQSGRTPDRSPSEPSQQTSRRS